MKMERKALTPLLKRSLSVLMVVIMLLSCMTVGMTALAGNDDTEEISVSEEKKSSPSAKSVQAYSSEGDFYYEIEDGAAIITGYNGDGGDVVIPDIIGGYPVTTIGENAFYWCDSLTSITIPDSVTTIGGYAFASCYSLTSVTIPDSVTTIGEYAFNGCDSLTSVTIENGVTNIENGAFNGCDSLTSVTIPDSVTTIGDYAFYYCYSLTSVTIGNSVRTVGDYAFSNCYSLISIIIPDSVTTIGERAFYWCDGLKSVTIPASVTTIGDSAFAYCINLIEVIVDHGNEYYSSDENGILFNKDKTELIQYPIGNERNYYVIYDSVTTIGEEAFCGCFRLTSIIIPDSVTTVGVAAFGNCTRLTSITIPASVTSIGASAFYDCNSLTSVTIPDSVTSIGVGAFGDCASLAEIIVNHGNEYYCSDENGILFNKDKTELIQYPAGNERTSYVIPNGVTTIKKRAFESCYHLTSVTIPDSVTIIEEYAFAWCNSLTSITISNSVKTIGDSAFSDCDSLTCVYYNGHEKKWSSIEIQWNNEPFTEATIYFCEGVTRTFPAQVPTCTENGYTEGVYCDDCDSWISGHDIIPATHTDENGDNICDLCGQNVSDIAFDERKTIKINADEITYLKFIPQTSGTYTFYSISDDDTYGYLFDSNKEELYDDDDDGEGYNFSLSCYLEAGETYYWGARYYDWQTGTFDVMLVFGEISDPDDDWDDDWDDDDYSYSINEDGETITITDYSGYEEELVIPDMLDDYLITAIGERTFYGCYRLTSVTIPDSVTTIGEEAFSNCDSLTSITITDSVTTIGKEAFYACDSLTSIAIPDSVTAIGDNAFSNCDSLTSITIPDSVTIIGDFAFNDCDSLTSVTIGNSVASIGECAFNSCYSLTEIFVDMCNENYSSDDGVLFNKDRTTLIQYLVGNKRTSYVIPDSVTAIGDNAFSNCDSLTSITIPDSVTIIGDFAFDDCCRLTSVTIPDSVTTIGDYAFNDCDSLTSVTIGNGVTTIGDFAFDGCTSLASVTIGNGVTNIGNNTFNGCDNLTKIIVGSDNESYSSDENGVLFNKDKTELIKYPAGNDRTSYVIPDGVIIIGRRSFDNSDCLKSIVIPDSVMRISDPGLSSCYKLTDMYYSGNEEQWSKVVKSDGKDGFFATIHFNYVPEHTHSHTLTSTTLPTCTSQGYTTYTCSCGDSYKGAYTNALGHKSNAGVVTKNATCTAAGVKTYSCTVCKAVTKTETVKASGHKETTLAAKKATYTQTGLTAGKQCSVCKTVTAKQTVTPKLTLGKVTKLKASSVKTTSMKLSWAKVTGAEKYEVYRSTDGKKWTKVATTDKTSYTVKKLKAGTTYKYKVRAVVGSAKGSYSSVITQATKPATVTLSSLKSAKAKQLTVNWKTVTGATGYEVTYSTSKKFTKKTTKTATVKKQKTKKTTLKKLKSGKKYYAKVRAYKTVNGKKIYGAYSKVKSVTVK